MANGICSSELGTFESMSLSSAIELFVGMQRRFRLEGHALLDLNHTVENNPASLWPEIHNELSVNSSDKHAILLNGVALSKLPFEERDMFWQLLWQLRDLGVTFIFHPDYNRQHWTHPDDAKFQFDLCFQISEFVALDLQKFANLYGDDSSQKLDQVLAAYSTKQRVFIRNAEYDHKPHYRDTFTRVCQDQYLSTFDLH